LVFKLLINIFLTYVAEHLGWIGGVRVSAAKRQLWMMT